MVSASLISRTIAEVAAEALCRQSFPEFLTWCKIRSDDPLSPGVIPLTPWPFQIERAEAWERGESEVILKERQMGFSAVLVAPYLLWRAMYHGWSCGYLSKGEAEAVEEITRIGAIYDELPDFLKVPGRIRSQDATFDGGGRVIAFPSTASAGISYTLQCVVMDEAGFHPYGAANYAAIQPAASKGQFIIQSTADPEIGPSGFFHDMYWASKRAETPYKAVFVARCRPDRDAAWYVRTRSAYAGNLERFDAYYPETDAQAFTGKSGLVYPSFSIERHVKPATWEWAASVRKVAGVDFGGGDPTAVAMLGLSGGHHVHQFGEFYKRGPVPVSEIAGFITQFPGPGRVMCDPSQTVAIATLAQVLQGTGWEVLPADNKRGVGLEMVGFLLENDRLTIDPVCRDGIAEFPGYRWANRTDPNDKTRYATSTPVDNHADGHDSRRYGVIEITAMLHDVGPQMPRRPLNSRQPFSSVMR